MVFWSDSKEILLPHHMTQPPFFPRVQTHFAKRTRMPAYCLPQDTSCVTTTNVAFFESLFLSVQRRTRGN